MLALLSKATSYGQTVIENASNLGCNAKHSRRGCTLPDWALPAESGFVLHGSIFKHYAPFQTFLALAESDFKFFPRDYFNFFNRSVFFEALALMDHIQYAFSSTAHQHTELSQISASSALDPKTYGLRFSCWRLVSDKKNALSVSFWRGVFASSCLCPQYVSELYSRLDWRFLSKEFFNVSLTTMLSVT